MKCSLHSQPGKNYSKPYRWVCRIFPSGNYTMGKIPRPKPESNVTSDVRNYERKVLRLVEYTGTNYDQNVYELIYWKHRSSGRVIHTPPTPPFVSMKGQDSLELSSEATPDRGLTNQMNSATEDLKEGGSGHRGDASLGLSTVSNSRKSKMGLKGITNYGRSMVREGCYLLEHKYGKDNLAFVTLTVPYSGEDLKVIARNWGKVKHRYFEELARFYQRRNTELEYVAVTEIQEKRYKRLGEVAPHLHYCCNSKNGKTYVMTPMELRGLFQRVCERFVTSDVPFTASENIQKVKKNAGRYLSKYFSKGGGCIKKIAAEEPELLPSQYWAVSKTILKSVARETVVLYDKESWEFLTFVQDNVRDGNRSYTIHPVYVQISDGCEGLYGYWGACPPKYH